MAVRNIHHTISLLLLSTLFFFTSGCQTSHQEVVKIGLVAPFEGRYREIGYDVIIGIRAAIHEYNQSSEYSNVIIELVAYDDGGEPEEAVKRAKALVIDPQVKLVIGHWLDGTTTAAVPVYEEAGIPVIVYSVQPFSSDTTSIFNLSPSEQTILDAMHGWERSMPADDDAQFSFSFEQRGQVGGRNVIGGPDWGIRQNYLLAAGEFESIAFASGMTIPAEGMKVYFPENSVEQFDANYETLSNGAQPGIYAFTAYLATWEAINIVTGNCYHNCVGYDENGRISRSHVYIYQWDDESQVLKDVFESRD